MRRVDDERSGQDALRWAGSGRSPGASVRGSAPGVSSRLAGRAGDQRCVCCQRKEGRSLTSKQPVQQRSQSTTWYVAARAISRREGRGAAASSSQQDGRGRLTTGSGGGRHPRGAAGWPFSPASSHLPLSLSTDSIATHTFDNNSPHLGPAMLKVRPAPPCRATRTREAPAGPSPLGGARRQPLQRAPFAPQRPRQPLADLMLACPVPPFPPTCPLPPLALFSYHPSPLLVGLAAWPTTTRPRARRSARHRSAPPSSFGPKGRRTRCVPPSSRLPRRRRRPWALAPLEPDVPPSSERRGDVGLAALALGVAAPSSRCSSSR